ncbi:MAG: ABC transporter permease [Acidimicrobiia bacterium]
MGVLSASLRLQLQLVRANPDYLMALATTPLFAVIFMSVVRSAGRDDLIPHAVLAPVLIGLWAMSLFVSGEVISTDRDFEILETQVAAPADLAVAITGRVAAVTLLGLLAFVESWLVALLVFGVAVPVAHPIAFALGMVVSAWAMAATALVMAAVFVLSRSARTFQNSLSYPFYVLGGVIVPVSLLPAWMQPASRVVFLSWSSDLLRDTLRPGPIGGLGWRLGMIALLGLAGFLVGRWLVARLLDRVRRTGTLTFA